MDEPIKIKYKFEFEDGTEKDFELLFEPVTYNLVRTIKNEPPEWTKLSEFCCSTCKVNRDEFEYCPIAVHLKDLIDYFTDFPSFKKARITVESKERTYIRHTSIQQGVSGIFGLVMVASGCPLLGLLKPMARFHLPFATLEETQIRVFAFYLLAQYIKQQHGGSADWQMKKLNDIYEKIKKVNINIAEKIANIENEDASINAVVILNNFAESVTLSLEEEDLSMIEPLLKEFVDLKY